MKKSKYITEKNIVKELNPNSWLIAFHKFSSTYKIKHTMIWKPIEIVFIF